MNGVLTRRGFLQGGMGVAASALVATPALARGARSGAADLIIHGGRVLVLDPRFSTVEAVAIRAGQVIAVGRERDVLPLAGRGTDLIDARGATVLPGVNDSHIHLNSFGLTFPPFSFDVDTATIDELVARVGNAAAVAEPGAWVRGRGWNETRLPRAPTRADLDPVSGEHPVVLTDFSLHSTAANSRAIELAGVTPETPAPPGGVIEKDADGVPTGVFRETAQALIQSAVPPYSRDELAQATDVAIEVLHAQGVTSATDPGISPELLDLYAEITRTKRLPLRLTVLLHAGASPATMRTALSHLTAPRGVDPRSLRVAGVKIFADGIPTAARTAWLHTPYLDGTNGALTIDGATHAEQLANLHEMIKLAHAAGAQIGTHATGDATFDAVVDGYLRVLGRRRGRHPRHYLIHGDFAPRPTLTVMARHEIGVNMNAQIKFLIDRLLDPIVGPERTDYQWPYRSALDRGVRVSSGSDAPVTHPNWLQGVATAVLREGSLGNIAGPAERITVPEALRTYTSTPAWQDFADGWKGRLRPGMVGDVCVLDEDLLRVDPHDFADVPVRVTVLGGEVVYDRSSERAAAARGRTSTLRAAQARACYHGGVCCCTLSRAIQAGRV
jgi:predicted amidohydrolase YtcJ